MSHFTKQERCKIENFLLAGVTPQEMARNLGRSHGSENTCVDKTAIPKNSTLLGCI